MAVCTGSTHSVFGVFDGLGGHGCGDEASRIAAAIATDCANEAGALLTEALLLADKKIRAELRDAGTTGALLAIDADAAMGHIAHAGDSRIYRVRGNTLEHMTFDHNQAWEHSRGLNVSKEEVNAQASHIIVNCLGSANGPMPLRVETMSFTVESGDRFLLFTDGLNGDLEDEDILSLSTSGTPQEIVDRLLEAASQADDNTTVICVEAT